MARRMEMEKLIFHGDTSYDHKNSTFSQKKALEQLVKAMLEESILSMKIMKCKTFCIAELGCSYGPMDPVFAAESITKSVKAKYLSARTIPVPQFQVFFNDLPATDFNSVFSVLPSSVMIDWNGTGIATRSYFAAGVPGSFFGRLFPDTSLHFVHSSFSLHWLSQVPFEILEKNSVTWNKGKIFRSLAVGEACFSQFQKDFNRFLRARAEELVGGGRMVLLLMGRTSLDPSDLGFIAFSWESLESSLNYLVSQGLIEEEKVDSFNLPVFCPYPEEIRREVGREGSFEIQRLELLRKSDRFTKEEMDAMTGSASAKEAYGKKLAKQLRAALESLLKYHFGEEVMDALFQRCGETMGKRLSERIEYGKKGGNLVVVLQRK